MQRNVAIERRSQMQAVRHHQEAAAGARHEVSRQRQNVIRGRFIEIACRLIREQQQRLDRERAADRDPLLLATGQLLRVALQKIAEPEPFHKLFVPDGIKPAGNPRLEGEVVFDGEARDEVELLEDEAQAIAPQRSPFCVGQGDDIGTIKQNGSAIGGIKPGDEVQQCALAATRFSRQRHALAGFDIKTDTAQHTDRRSGG